MFERGKDEDKVQYLIYSAASAIRESDSWSEALYNHARVSWLARANDTAAHYAAIYCPRQRTV